MLQEAKNKPEDEAEDEDEPEPESESESELDLSDDDDDDDDEDNDGVKKPAAQQKKKVAKFEVPADFAAKLRPEAELLVKYLTETSPNADFDAASVRYSASCCLIACIFICPTFVEEQS